MVENIPTDCYTLINNLKAKYPALSSTFTDAESNLTQRLWYQLSENLTALSESPELQKSQDLITLYQGLLIFVEPAMNPMKFLKYVQNMLSNFKGKMNEALLFVQNIEKKSKYKDEHKIYIQIIKGYCYLEMNQMYELEDIINSVGNDFNKKIEIEPFIYSQYYKLSTLYYERMNNYDSFYINAFQYLGYETSITSEQKIDLCFKMCIAILIGEKSFNFEELVQKDFFKLMSGTKFEWISNLILCFSKTNVQQFLNYLTENKKQIDEIETLRNQMQFLELKIRIAALLDLIFQKNKNERTLTFQEIMKVCLCKEEQVEYMLMRTLSLGLIKGYIDQVHKLLFVTWVEPKFLDRDKLLLLKNRFDGFIEKSDRIMKIFKDNANDMLKC